MRTSDRAWRGPLDPPDSPVDRRFVPTVATVPPAFGGRHQSIGGGTDPMNPKLRLAALVAGLAIVASACAAGASPTPEPAAPTVAPTAAPPGGPTEPATLSGALTIWHAYGSSGGRAEFNAFSRILEKVQAANPGLTITAVEQPLRHLFTKL